MIISVNESPTGELFFSLPLSEELTIAEEQISDQCRKSIQQVQNTRLEYELEQMKKTKTAFHFLILKEICSLSKEKGHSIVLKGNIAGSFIAYLLGVSPFNPSENITTSAELIWESDKYFYIPDFEISISEQIRPFIQERLDEKFGYIKTNDNLYYKIRMTDWSLCDSVSAAHININNFDENICTKVLQKLFPEYETVSCNFEQLVNFYAYKAGSFSNAFCSEDLLDGDVVVTQDKLYFSLIANGVPKKLATEIVEKGITSTATQKEKYIIQLEEYSVPESIIFSVKNTDYLWNVASCVSRICLYCQNEYDKKK